MPGDHALITPTTNIKEAAAAVALPTKEAFHLSRFFVVQGAARPGNVGTVLGPSLAEPAPRSFEAAFVRCYPAIRAFCETRRSPGLALFLVGPRGQQAMGWLGARPGHINTATVGRHTAADLVLEADATLSLRQLMVILEPARRSWTDLRFRLLDLRAPSGMVDERGQRLGALQSEGPCFVRCGRSVLFCLPTGDDSSWPDDAHDGWTCIPERVYFDDEPAWAAPRPVWRPSPGVPNGRGSTTIRTHAGPRGLGRFLLGSDEPAVARLCVRPAEEREMVLLVGPAALRRGILLGRYERCDVSHEDTALGGSLNARAISRVHLLILHVGEQVYAIDTGSTYGVQRAGADVQEVAIEDGSVLDLAGGAASVTWKTNRRGRGCTEGKREPP